MAMNDLALVRLRPPTPLALDEFANGNPDESRPTPRASMGRCEIVEELQALLIDSHGDILHILEPNTQWGYDQRCRRGAAAEPYPGATEGCHTDGLEMNDDGSLTLYIQKDKPPPDKVSNWLPLPRVRST